MFERELLDRSFELVSEFLDSLPSRRVPPSATADDLRLALGGPVPERPTEPAAVVADLYKAADAGIMASPGPRFFGFVIGGTLPAALAADVLTTAWDQNAGLYAASPAASVAEEICAAWLLDILGLPATASSGLATGGQMANFTGLAAARHHVLAEEGWNVEERGLFGAPGVRVVTGTERHVTVDAALALLGFGIADVLRVPSDGQGRMIPEELKATLSRRTGPTIVCAQAGNVNTGAFDPLSDVCDIAHDVGAFVHVDGAFGLWAAAAPSLRHLTDGCTKADSWAADAHKWLNVPYDSGIVFSAHPDSHRAAMAAAASYLVKSSGATERDELDWVPEFSRRARAFPIWAAIRSLGRSGIAEMIERCCAHARRFAEVLSEAPEAEILNDVVLNQVLVRFPDAGGDHDRRTREVVRRVQEDGTCWLGGSMWKNQAVMRISVSNWSTTAEDVERSVDAILRAARSF